MLRRAVQAVQAIDVAVLLGLVLGAQLGLMLGAAVEAEPLAESVAVVDVVVRGKVRRGCDPEALDKLLFVLLQIGRGGHIFGKRGFQNSGRAGQVVQGRLAQVLHSLVQQPGRHVFDGNATRVVGGHAENQGPDQCQQDIRHQQDTA
ncbi:hypothetical protein D9M70_337530 [compost metagenome]